MQGKANIIYIYYMLRNKMYRIFRGLCLLNKWESKRIDVQLFNQKINKQLNIKLFGFLVAIQKYVYGKIIQF